MFLKKTEFKYFIYDGRFQTKGKKGKKKHAHLKIMGSLLRKKNVQKENFLTPVVQLDSETCWSCRKKPSMPFIRLILAGMFQVR